MYLFSRLSIGVALAMALSVALLACQPSSSAMPQSSAPDKTSAVPVKKTPVQEDKLMYEGLVSGDFRLEVYAHKIIMHSDSGAVTVFDDLHRKKVRDALVYTSSEVGLESFEASITEESCQDGMDARISIGVDGMSMQGCARVVK